MRQFLWVLFAAVLSSVLTYSLTLRAQAHSAQVVTDEKNGIIRFVIDGTEVAQITAEGLHVRNDVRFGGVITDVGIENYGKDLGLGGQ